MAIEEYKSNSHKTRERKKERVAEKKVEKIISGSAKSKKKSGIQKITNIFAPDDVVDVKGYILEDIVVPAVKDIILDTVRAFLGVNGSSRGKSSTSSRVPYRKYYDDRERRDSGNRNRRTVYEYDDIILDNRGEAEDVLARMDELIDTYGSVSVGDFYELVGISGNFTDYKYGWSDIHNASVMRVSDGYMIKLPRAVPLN